MGLVWSGTSSPVCDADPDAGSILGTATTLGTDTITCKVSSEGKSSQNVVMRGVGSQARLYIRTTSRTANARDARDGTRLAPSSVVGSGEISVCEIDPDDVITVRLTRNGHSGWTPVRVDRSLMVIEFKRCIRKSPGVDVVPRQMTLRLPSTNCHMKDDSRTLASYGVSDGTVVQVLVGGLRGGATSGYL